MKKNILGIAVAVLLLFGCATKTPSSSASSSSAPDSVSDQSSAVSSVAVRHSIQAKVLAGEGSLEFSKTSAERGETITVDVKAGESDKLEKIASDQVSLSLIQEGLQYSFVMPDEDVTIQVSFRARESFRVIDILDFASKPVGITGLTVGDSVLEGTETTVTVRRISFAAEQKPLLIQANDEFTSVDFDDEGVFTWKFAFPSQDTYLAVTDDSSSETGYPVTYDSSDFYHIFGLDPKRNYQNPVFYATETPGHVLKDITAKGKTSGKDISVRKDLQEKAEYYPCHLYSLSEPAVISGKLYEGVAHSITYVNTDHFQNLAELPTQWVEGERLDISYYAKDDMSVTSLSGTYLKDSVPTAISSDIIFTDFYDFGLLAFPQGDVTLTLTWTENVAFTIEENEHVLSHQTYRDPGFTLPCGDNFPLPFKGARIVFYVSFEVASDYEVFAAALSSVSGAGLVSPAVHRISPNHFSFTCTTNEALKISPHDEACSSVYHLTFVPTEGLTTTFLYGTSATAHQNEAIHFSASYASSSGEEIEYFEDILDGITYSYKPETESYSVIMQSDVELRPVLAKAYHLTVQVTDPAFINHIGVGSDLSGIFTGAGVYSFFSAISISLSLEMADNSMAPSAVLKEEGKADQTLTLTQSGNAYFRSTDQTLPEADLTLVISAVPNPTAYSVTLKISGDVSALEISSFIDGKTGEKITDSLTVEVPNDSTIGFAIPFSAFSDYKFVFKETPAGGTENYSGVFTRYRWGFLEAIRITEAPASLTLTLYVTANA